MTRVAPVAALRSTPRLAQPTTVAEGAVSVRASEGEGGALGNLTSAWEDVQRTRLALDQRAIPSDGMKIIEDRLSRQIRSQLEAHPIWPWLKQYPGLGGVHVARLVSLIGDPHRFPGHTCGVGHHHSAADRMLEREVVRGCGIELADGTACAALVGPIRRGNGTRSLWHYLGLHVVDGHSPRKVKGQRADWNPRGRTVVMMPGGIAEQIVRLRAPVYRDIYDAKKAQLTRERAGKGIVIEIGGGPLPNQEAEVGTILENGGQYGLRPFQIDAIARKYAAKQFVADLLQAWKLVVPLGTDK